MGAAGTAARYVGVVAEMAAHYRRVSRGPVAFASNMAVALRWKSNSRAYRSMFGVYPNYMDPVSWTEKLQYRKVFDRNPDFGIFCDKHAVRAFAAARAPGLGLPKLHWVGARPEDIPFDDLPLPYVIKPNNRSQRIFFVRQPGDLDRAAVVEACREWQALPPNNAVMAEWGYSRTSNLIMVEECLPGPAPGTAPPDMKFFTFGGKVVFIRYSTGRNAGGAALRGFYGPDWSHLPLCKVSGNGLEPMYPDAPRPPNLAAMVEAAERISAGTDFLRVDLYNIGGAIYLGELTVYPMSGFGTVHYEGQDGAGDHVPNADRDIGAHWILPQVPWAARMWRAMLG